MKHLDSAPFQSFIRGLMDKGESTWTIAAHTHLPECPRFDAQEQREIGEPCIGCGGIERRTLMRILTRQTIREDVGELLAIRLGSHPWLIWGVKDTRREACVCGCGTKLLQPMLQGRPRMYASDACRMRAYRSRKLARNIPESIPDFVTGGV